MQPQRNDSPWQNNSPFWQRFIRRNIPLLIYLFLAFAGMLAVYWYFNPSGGDAEVIASVVSGTQLSAPLVKNVPAKPVEQRLAQSTGPRRIGIIAGHKGFDSGAVCADGLTEASINAALAEKLAVNLQSNGIRTEILDEFDARLTGYSAAALISIHADSCEPINELATGFKISGSSFTDSSKLSICMENAYGTATQLPYHANTITADMANYHAFREISPGTPAIIIEVGFMYLDRKRLTIESDPVVIGLVNGVTCFLEQS
ncbi:MAG: N-acetylmuramoyl-L-alanine amidase [Ardenticatenaceae bacterium]|nr:N-acetylmuramoyl-L-alanine amidase [Ardenticatenaceae bacterium]MCB9445563.1 N-acetylmuramoyl-L-alanine amidase [Ardenticatenaceae bacterium]